MHGTYLRIFSDRNSDNNIPNRSIHNIIKYIDIIVLALACCHVENKMRLKRKYSEMVKWFYFCEEREKCIYDI